MLMATVDPLRAWLSAGGNPARRGRNDKSAAQRSIGARDTLYMRSAALWPLLELARLLGFCGCARGGGRRPKRLVGMAREADAGFRVVVVRDVAASLEDRFALLGVKVRRAQEPSISTPPQRVRGRDLRLQVRHGQHDRAQAVDVQPLPEARIFCVRVRNTAAFANIRLDLGRVAVDADDVLVLLPQIVVRTAADAPHPHDEDLGATEGNRLVVRVPLL